MSPSPQIVIATTDSHHDYRVYPNLAQEMTLTAVNQLWIADITYIRLEAEFVYRAVLQAQDKISYLHAGQAECWKRFQERFRG